jgi:hypothetical protein
MKEKIAGMVTLRNDFHGTSARVKPTDGLYLSPRQVKRARDKLCGVSECVCSGRLGTRGPQEVLIEPRWGDWSEGAVVCQEKED